MFPGRFRPGLGHCVREVMQQAGVAVDSPLTWLGEQVRANDGALRGTHGDDRGKLLVVGRRDPPVAANGGPGLLSGGRGPLTLAFAGELAVGVILDGVAPGGIPDVKRHEKAVAAVRSGRADARLEDDPEVVAVVPFSHDLPAEELSQYLTTLGHQGVTTVAAVAVEPEGLPIGDDRVLSLIEKLSAAADG
nr:LLM class flavin-dependent oxidoreductase [uncultured Serinicoccus sp.]